MAEIQEDRMSENEDEALKRRLIRRIAVAGVLIVVLLGGLAVFDALNEQPVAEKTAALPPKEPEPAAEQSKTEEKSETPTEENASEKEAEGKETGAEEARVAERPRLGNPSRSAPSPSGPRCLQPRYPKARQPRDGRRPPPRLPSCFVD